jgi:hypothetical protein
MGIEGFILFKNSFISIIFVYLRYFWCYSNKLEVSKDNPILMLVRMSCGWKVLWR